VAYGFKAMGEGGFIQIDENYRNYQLVARGSVTPNEKPNAFQASPTINISFTGRKVPMLAIRARDGVTNVVYSRTSSNINPTFTIWAGGEGVLVDWYLFDLVEPQDVPGLLGYGMRIRNAANEIVYEHRYKPQRVTGMVSRAINLVNDPSWAVAPGRVYAFVTVSLTEEVRSYGVGGTAGVIRYFHAARQVGSTVFLGELPYNIWTGTNPSSYPFPQFGGHSQPSIWVIVDVTNY